MPIYLVKTPQGEKLVDAKTKAQAINHVTKNTITAEPVSASYVVRLMQDGVAVEKAGQDLSQHTEAPVTRSADVEAMDAPASHETQNQGA